MNQIENRLNNWRGSRVLKLIFYIKAKRNEVRQSKDEITYFLKFPEDKSLNYGTYTALQKTLMFVNKTFDVKSTPKETFNKKTFGANRILSVLEFLEFELRVLKKQLKALDQLIDDDNGLTYFKGYFQAQEKVFLEVADLIVTGQFNDYEFLIDEHDDLI